MEPGILTRYSASAGSGKTFQLTRIFLSKLFRSRYNYKKILAVTFTNKAASDMKRKILGELYNLARGEKTEISSFLTEETGKSSEVLKKEAGEILEIILHDYSGFFVGTIDSFFQKVLRSFTREIGLQHGYTIEIDHSVILRHSVDDMLAAISTDPLLRNWITEYAKVRIEDGKNWNLKDDILALAEEIFKEKFKLLTEKEREVLKDRDFLISYTKGLKKLRKDFEDNLVSYAGKCSDILQKHNVEDNMFLRGNNGGVPTFLSVMRSGHKKAYKHLNATIGQLLEQTPVWTTKAGPSAKLKNALSDGFGDVFIEAVKYYNDNYLNANTAAFILENIYTLGILADILNHIHVITSSENRFLLSDAAELLYLIIAGDQTPFIYEKIGNVFDYFMIDEFQDTSLIQWNNFRPLIENSLSEGKENLVVGDAKQSIYRWRNSDWKIFDSLLQNQLGNERIRTEHLANNWRSKKKIVDFNNALFSILPSITGKALEVQGNTKLQDLYSDSYQEYPGNKDSGFVKLEFVEEEDEMTFNESVLKKLPSVIEGLQDRGYSGSDIGILVRTNNEGASVLKYILGYQSSLPDSLHGKYNYNIVSNESLLLSASPAINFIISSLKGLFDPDDNISRAIMVRSWLLATDRNGDDLFEGLKSDGGDKPEEYFPNDYVGFLERVKRMPLFEAVENIILFFNLGLFPDNTAYLNAFQDYVLEFSGNNSADISSFLEWWDSTGIKKSIILSDQQNSMRVMTIHKSKGLEFKAVIVPFISWNLGHSKNPTFWVKPSGEPFNKLGLVPIKYKGDLQYSHFQGDYVEETLAATVDSLNLLYVAFTRAVDCLYGFCPAKSKSTSISTAINEALKQGTTGDSEKPLIMLNKFLSEDKRTFSYGEIPDRRQDKTISQDKRITSTGYYVNHGISRLYLKFHGESWMLKLPDDKKNRLNHGRIMHEVFESVFTADDIPEAVSKLVLEGKIPESEKAGTEEMMMKAVSDPAVSDWFKPGLKVINEAEILTTGGTAKRPDRVILLDEKVILIDFKFGVEKADYLNQVNNYRKLLLEMGYSHVEAYLWFVDNNKIIKVE